MEDLKSAIIKRKSVRTYNNEELKENDTKLIKTFISDKESCTGIYGNSIRILLKTELDSTVGKIGTYGIIKGTSSYLIVICHNTKEALIDCGYVFEKLVLYLQANNIHTCWLGGTFNRKKLKTNIELSDDEFIAIISPVGYGAEKKSFSDRTIRNLAKGDMRKEASFLFFEEDFSKPIKDKSILDTLNYVRLSPSASNKQPWRIVVDHEGQSHFYLERTPNYGKGALGYDIQMIDMGISLCHFHTAVPKARFVDINYSIKLPNEYTEYITSAI